MEKPSENRKTYKSFMAILFLSLFFTSIRYVSFISISETLIIILFLLLAIKEFKDFQSLILPIIISLTLAIIFIALTNDLAIEPLKSAVNVGRIFTHFAILFSVIYLGIKNIDDARSMLYVFIIAGALSVALAELPWFRSFVVLSGQRSGFFNYTPVLSGILITISLQLAIYFVTDTRTRKWWLIPTIPVLLIGIERTQTVSALTLIALSNLLFYVATIFRRSIIRNFSYLFLGFLAAAIVLNTFELTWNRLLVILNPSAGLSRYLTGRESTIESRIASIKYSIELANSKPLTGLGFDYSSQIVPYLAYQPHNFIVLSLQSGGILLMLLSLVLLFECLRSISRSLINGDFISLTLVLIPIAAMFTNPIISSPTLLAPMFLGLIVQRRFGGFKKLTRT